MPIYVYTCNRCKVEFEKIIRISERESASLHCPDCGCEEVSRVMTRTSFTLKGGGWYKDGY